MHNKAGYRPDIDGLRAIAVLSVLAYHYGLPSPGGFTGVDIFFVISGFLITSQLAVEIEAGQFSLLRFYDRRVRRIVPALTVMLTVSLTAGYWMLLPGDYRDLATSAAAAAFGFSNFHFLNNTGYFDQSAALMPLLHTWSLAVEEQFYLAWPLLLYVIAKGRSRAFIVGVLALAVAGGFAFSLLWMGRDPKGAFFLPFPRAWELALGALLVFLPPLRRASGESAAVLGLGLIGVGFAVVSATGFPGAAALYPCIGAALVVWPRTKPTMAGTALGVLAPIGKISYSLYLWHWPVWVYFRVYINNGKPTPSEAFALVGVALLLAWLSYRYIEQPFRRPRWRPSRAVTAGLSASAAVLCAGAFVAMHEGLPSRMPADAYAMRSREAMWEWPCGTRDIVGLKDVCVFGADWDTAETKAVLWGDSHAEVLASLIESAAKTSGSAVLLYRGCPAIIDGVRIKREMADIPNYSERCGGSRDEIMGVLRTHPDIRLVILANSWRTASWALYEGEHYSEAVDFAAITQWERLSTALELRLLREGVDHAVTELDSMGKTVVIVGNVPGTIGDPVSCAVVSNLLRRGCPPHANAMSLERYERLDLPIRAALNSSSAYTITPGDALCAGPYCTLRLNGEFLYRDQNHIRRNLTQPTRDALSKLTGIDNLFRLARPNTRASASAPSR